MAAAIRASDTYAIFVGPNEFGDRVHEELLTAQDRAARAHSFRLIPVLLPGLPDPWTFGAGVADGFAQPAAAIAATRPIK